MAETASFNSANPKVQWCNGAMVQWWGAVLVIVGGQCGQLQCA